MLSVRWHPVLLKETNCIIVLILYKKIHHAKNSKSKNKTLFGFHKTENRPSAETTMKKSKKRGPKTVPVPILKLLRKLKKTSKTDPFDVVRISKSAPF